MDKGEKIKDQGFVPYAKQKTVATSKGPQPGAGKGKQDGKKRKKKSTKAKKMEALKKKKGETSRSKDPTMVADISDDRINNDDNSRRDMLNNHAVEDADSRGPVGNNRFDVEADGAEDMPRGDEKGGGFF